MAVLSTKICNTTRFFVLSLVVLIDIVFLVS